MISRWAEVLIMGGALVVWTIPLAAGGWALVTLHRIRITQEAMRQQLEAIERSLGSA